MVKLSMADVSHGGKNCFKSVLEPLLFRHVCSLHGISMKTTRASLSILGIDRPGRCSDFAESVKPIADGKDTSTVAHTQEERTGWL